MCVWLFSGIFQIFSYALHAKASVAEEYKWVKIGYFSTWFNENERGRCENIKLAIALIDGVTLQPYGEFSFNQTVGKRTAKAGFKGAKIIQNGEYTMGIGGGVCQVSTTLYNVALLSGLTVTEFHPHSLAVSYVSPSRDAMVSSNSDFRLYNPYPYSVRICLQAKKGDLLASVYGLNAPKEGRSEYKIFTRVVEEILPPEAEERFGEKEEILRKAKNGIRSEAYLERYDKGALVSRKLLRKDKYLPIREIIVKKIEDTTKKTS
ncbi:MAG: VanW family protein [Clostridia bacterium]|nr:VanW family protein [Clostridia bacterium]